MGCLQSAEARRESEINQKINRQIHEENAKEKAKPAIKLLLLGAGESGKSTVLKQMRIIHGGGYSREDRLATRDVIFSNVVQSMKIIVEAMVNIGIPLSDPATIGKHFDFIRELRFQVETDVFPPEIATAIKALWRDEGVLACFARSREYQLNDSARYYFDSIDRISAPEYIPTDEDILYSRVKTTGIVESSFMVNDKVYRIFDVGGQRSERRKWIHCFENVTAIFFIVAISEYDQKLIEDDTTNRLCEAVKLFDNIVHNRWFIDTPFIVFLNKKDLFDKKLKNSPLENHFPEYIPDDFRQFDEPEYEFVKSLFIERYNDSNAEDAANESGPSTRAKDDPPKPKTQTRDLYIFPSCATDTDGMRKIVSSACDIIIKQNLQSCGLL